MALTIVQRTPAVATTALADTTTVLVFGTPPVVGRAVVVAASGNHATTLVTSVTDNYGNTYGLAKDQGHASGPRGVAVWFCPAITATGATFTITITGSFVHRMGIAIEISGVGTGLLLDQTAGAATGTTGTTTGATAALTGDESLQVAAVGLAITVGTLTVAGAVPAWTQEAEALTGLQSGEIDSRVVGAAAGTTPSATWTWSGGAFAASAIVAFKPGAVPITGSAVFGVSTTVRASRAIAFGLDGNTNTHDDDGTFKVFGKVAITGDLEVGGALPAHAATHEAGGVDPIPLDALAAPSDNTDLNASTTAHGLLRKLSGSDLQVLRGDGTWGMSPLTSGVFAYTFSTTTTEPPGSQRIRFNAAHPYTAVTKLWADFLTSNSEDIYWGWMRIRVGSLVLVQDKDNHLQFAEFITTGVPIDKGTYVEVPVAWASNGTALAVQGVLVRVTAPAPASATASYMSPVTTGGDPTTAALIFAPDGDVVMVPVTF